MTLGSSRRSERERVLGLLYEAEAKDVALEEVAADVGGYAAEAAIGIAADQQEIDSLIRRFSKGWDLERMPSTDRALLRLSVWELLRRPDVPTAVTISEAVELAKRYSTEDSGRFVNGVLSAIAAAVRG
ncbi:MAG: transcription antitermination factor NusB [Acidimicrobiia bacterium]